LENRSFQPVGFSARCSSFFKSAFNQMNRYAYRYATTRNKRGEPLSVLVT
jgi:hypothetical protein